MWFLRANSEDSGLTGRMPRLIKVLAERICNSVVLSCIDLQSLFIWESSNIINIKIESYRNLSRDMRLPKRSYVRPAKLQTSLRIRAV